MGGVRAQSRGGVAGRLAGEGGALSRREVVVELEGAHVRRVDEAVLRQTQVSVRHLARRVMPGEGAEPRELVTGIQEHCLTWDGTGRGKKAEGGKFSK